MMVEADTQKDSDNELQVHKYTFMGLFFKLLFATLWFVFLNYLCKNGHTRMAWFFLLLPVVFMIFMLILGSFFMAYIVSSQGTALKKMKDAKQHKEGAQMEGMEMEGMLPKEGVRRMLPKEGVGPMLPKEGVGPMQIEGMHHKMEGMHHKMDGYHPF
tara:strand:- start:6202 stop:6672 length:471 start_codon:yes stop_codon:yes gene_type:complete